MRRVSALFRSTSAKPCGADPDRRRTGGTLVGASRVGDRIILSYLGDAKSEARMVALDGKPVANINLGEIGTASGFGGKPGDPETFYAFSRLCAAHDHLSP